MKNPGTSVSGFFACGVTNVWGLIIVCFSIIPFNSPYIRKSICSYVVKLSLAEFEEVNVVNLR
jgi:hypothetical protein